MVSLSPIATLILQIRPGRPAALDLSFSRSVGSGPVINIEVLLPGWRYSTGLEKANSLIALDSVELVWSDDHGLEIYKAKPDGSDIYFVSFCRDHIFKIDLAARVITLSGELGQAASSDIEHFLFDQVVPRIRSHCGEFVLHAGSVQLGNSIVAFIGQSGRGKSTMIAGFLQAGFSIMGDDALAISCENQIIAKPVYPSLRVLPDTLEALFETPPRTKSVAHYTPKRRVMFTQSDRMKTDNAYLTGIILLNDRSVRDEIRLDRLSPTTSCMELIENSFALDPKDGKLAARKLRDASKLANEVPVFELTYPRDYSCLPDVRSAILREFKRWEPSR